MYPNFQPIEINVGIDLIGDIHGCYEEFIELLDKLGYQKNSQGLYTHPEGRKIVSLGDIHSRGPYSLRTIGFFIRHVKAGNAYLTDSNHGWKIARWLDGKKVTLAHGDEKVSIEWKDYERASGQQSSNLFKKEARELLLNAPSHLIFTKGGRGELVAVHAGIRDDYIGKDTTKIRSFCRYGDTDGFDENGKPIRKDWFLKHRSQEWIIWGHDPRPEPMIINKTVNIDQGVVFGGQLTAFRFPEQQFIQVKAKKDYANVDDNPLKRFGK